MHDKGQWGEAWPRSIEVMSTLGFLHDPSSVLVKGTTQKQRPGHSRKHIAMHHNIVQIQCYPSTKRSVSCIVERQHSRGHSSGFPSELDASSRTSFNDATPLGPCHAHQNPGIQAFISHGEAHVPVCPAYFPAQDQSPGFMVQSTRMFLKNIECSTVFGIGFDLDGRIAS